MVETMSAPGKVSSRRHTFSVHAGLERNVILIEELEHHKSRRKASFLYYVKSLAVTLATVNLIWAIGSGIIVAHGCSAIKQFKDECGCNGGAARFVDAVRYFFLQFWPLSATYFIMLYKVSKLRHGKRIDLTDTRLFMPPTPRSNRGAGATDVSPAPASGDLRPTRVILDTIPSAVENVSMLSTVEDNEVHKYSDKYEPGENKLGGARGETRTAGGGEPPSAADAPDNEDNTLVSNKGGAGSLPTAAILPTPSPHDKKLVATPKPRRVSPSRIAVTATASREEELLPPDRVGGLHGWLYLGSGPHLHPDDVVPLDWGAVIFVAKNVGVQGVLWVFCLTFFTGVLELSIGFAYGAYMLSSVYFFLRAGRWLNSNMPDKSARDTPGKPIVRYIYVRLFAAFIISTITAVLESHPQYAGTVISLFPFFISMFEFMIMRMVARCSSDWSDNDLAVLARQAVCMVESFRSGVLLTAASMEENEGALQGPFFNSLCVSIVLDGCGRNDLFMTAFKTWVLRRPAAAVADARSRFKIIYQSAKIDGGYVGWFVVLMMALHNSAPSTSMLDCQLKPVGVYSPGIEFIAACLLGELFTDLFSSALRYTTGILRPLWVMPHYFVSTEGSLYVRVILWAGLFSTSVVSLTSTAMMMTSIS